MALIIPHRGDRVLRENIRKLETDLQSNFQSAAEEARNGLTNVKEEKLDEYIVTVFSQFENSTIRHIRHTRDNVRNEAPRRENYSTDEDFMRAQSDFRVFVSSVTLILFKLNKWFTELFEKISDFFKELWTSIKNHMQNIAENINEFVKKVSDMIADLYKSLFDDN
ncbi:hypothetical protein Glove_357g4 [Diversispora epigaea]|uniref:Uncharacterized protein n=1 Tax=Diversispora epigaea TaxID=1348612 RepID=A0A397HAV1_9GLOM|nr:hypothetical protein Glove_357g4 [Diversispora epigaea]